MKRPALFVWSFVFYNLLYVLATAKDSSDNDNVRLKVSILKDSLTGVASCQHTFSQVELLNLVSEYRVRDFSRRNIQSSCVGPGVVVKCDVIVHLLDLP